MMKILLDLDGVLCNWEKACCGLFGISIEYARECWTPGDYMIDKAIGKTEAEIWAKINEAGEDWWANLEEYPWARRLYDSCVKLAPTYFVTSPSDHPSSLAGKLRWMQTFTGDKNFYSYLIGPKKYLCAKDGQILVDDSDKKVNGFRKEGGTAILFPRFNNSAHHYPGDPATYAIEELSRIADIYRKHRAQEPD